MSRSEYIYVYVWLAGAYAIGTRRLHRDLGRSVGRCGLRRMVRDVYMAQLERKGHQKDWWVGRRFAMCTKGDEAIILLIFNIF